MRQNVLEWISTKQVGELIAIIQSLETSFPEVAIELEDYYYEANEKYWKEEKAQEYLMDAPKISTDDTDQ